MNRAVTALYEPGSTFKLITLAAAFDQGITNPDEVFDCENGATYVAGHKIHDHKRFGLLTVADILALSSDVGAIKIAERLGEPKFYEYIQVVRFWLPDRCGHAWRKPRNRAAAVKLVAHFHRRNFHGSGGWCYADPTDLRRFRHRQWRHAV